MMHIAAATECDTCLIDIDDIKSNLIVGDGLAATSLGEGA